MDRSKCPVAKILVYTIVHGFLLTGFHLRLDAQIYPFNLKEGNFVSEPREPAKRQERTKRYVTALQSGFLPRTQSQQFPPLSPFNYLRSFSGISSGAFVSC